MCHLPSLSRADLTNQNPIIAFDVSLVNSRMHARDNLHISGPRYSAFQVACLSYKLSREKSNQ